jgi:hypothetical protein
MVRIHQGSPGDLLRQLIGPGREPVTLICPELPAQSVLDQTLVAANQHGRLLRVVTSLHGSGPNATRAQIEGLLRLEKLGARVKVADRGALPPLLLSPPSGCAILPSDWGYSEPVWQRPMVIDRNSSSDIIALSEKIWRQAGSFLSSRRLKTALRWLEEIADDSSLPPEGISDTREEVDFSDLSLFDKRRGSRRSSRLKSKADKKAWWTFHGTDEERVNPFLPVRLWVMQHDTHKCVRFPAGRRPTGIKTGDWIFFVIHSREPGGEPETYVVGRGQALAYRPLVDDYSGEPGGEDDFLMRYPHALRLEMVQLIRGAVGEGVQAYSLMNELGPRVFESTMRNKEKGGGNVDPHKSIAQKTMILLSGIGAAETHRLLDTCLRRLGCVTISDIELHRD